MKHKKLPLVLFLLSVFILLVFTRFVNLGWGLPYPMHPDERNMVLSILQLECEPNSSDGCLNPKFFAYGQLPLYTTYFLIKTVHFIQNDISKPISFEDATLTLRLIAAVLAVATGLLLYSSLGILASYWLKKGKALATEEIFYKRLLALISLVIVFVPGLIQLSHFGTTESLLMFAYSALVWLSIRLLAEKTSLLKFTLLSALVTACALASKLSALPFGIIPVLALILHLKFKLPKKLKLPKTKKDRALYVDTAKAIGIHAGFAFLYGGLALLLGAVLSPYNWIEYSDFYSSMYYETGVGLGTMDVFYTRSFLDTAPILFQFGAIFPYILGLPLFIFFLLGFIFLPWKRKEFNLLRFAFLLSFVSQAFLYAKWTRFIAPVFPISVLIGAVFMVQLYVWIVDKVKHIRHSQKVSRGIFATLILFTIVPGVAFTSIYIKPDVRYTASAWIYQNIPENSILLAETANVVDIPIIPPNATWELKPYEYISFDFYNLDTNPTLQQDLKTNMDKADYIIINSRRVFKNHTCLQANENRYKALISVDQGIPLPLYTPITDQTERCRKLLIKYPALQEYYKSIFAEQRFKMVAQFASYPEISLFGFPIIEFPDENAEETWSVFDHPVIRIYKKQ